MTRVLPLAISLSVAACADPDPQKPGASQPSEPATAHWMQDVFADHEDVALGAILLPGAFNSSSYACAEENGISPDTPATVLTLWDGLETPAGDFGRERIVDWAKTQERSIGEQLTDGIRAIEINLTHKDGEIVTWHSVYGVPVDEVLDEVVAFAVGHPSEVVVLSFGLTLDSADWPAFVDALAAPRTDGLSVCDLLYDGSDSAALATLAQIRASGRTLVWGADGDLRSLIEARGDCPQSNRQMDVRWSLTTTPQGVRDRLAETVPGRDLGRLLQNDFVFSLDGSQSDAEQVGYVVGYSSLAEASETLGFWGDFPGDLIAEFDGSGEMNLFAGAHYEHTNLVEAAMARNKERLAR